MPLLIYRIGRKTLNPLRLFEPELMNIPLSIISKQNGDGILTWGRGSLSLPLLNSAQFNLGCFFLDL
jgi:hypothetical protein